MLRIDIDNTIIGVNKAVEKWFGIKTSEVINQPLDVFNERIKDCFEDPEVFLKSVHHTTYSTHEDGSLNILDMANSAVKLIKPREALIAVLPREILSVSGELLGRMLTFADVTQLGKTTSLLRTVVDVSPVPTIVSKLDDGRIIFANEPLATLVGLKQDELIGQQTPDFYADPGARAEVVRRIKKDGYLHNHEVRIRKTDGTVIWMIFNLTISELAGDTVIVGALYDIDERRKAEEALRVSEARFRSLVENADDIIYSMDPSGTFTYLSPKFEELTGFPVEEYIGRPLVECVEGDGLSSMRNWLACSPKGDDKLTGQEFCFRHKNGDMRWFVSHNSIIRDEDENVLEIIGIAHDITEMRRVLGDLEKANQHLIETQGQLVQSEKMASLGMLVAGIAHEINTPIGAVNSMHNTSVRAMQKLRETMKSICDAECLDNEKMIVILKLIDEANRVIETGVERITTIVRRLRSFARLDEAELKKADLHEGLEDTLVLIHHEIKHNIEIVRNYDEIPSISCYPGRLNQVFLNILINAKQAIRDKGKITISTHLDNGKVFIEFADTGGGIPKEELSKIFDPGYTTKGVRVGTGLGLSICYQIIQDHHGEIRVHSEVDKGTTFTIIIPTNLDET